MAPDVVDPLARLHAERACERLLVEFVRRLDLGDPAEVATLFTEDGVWAWPAGGRRVQGRPELARYFGSRPADRLSRRLCTNVLVTRVTARAPPKMPRGDILDVALRGATRGGGRRLRG